MSQWESVASVARRLGVSRQAVHKRVAAGKLIGWRLKSKRTVVYVADVERWQQERSA